MHNTPALRGALIVLALMLACGGTHPANALTLPSGIVEIGDEAFLFDTSFTELVLPEGVTTIGSGAFAGTALREVTLPWTLMSIADDAFQGCPIELAHAQWGSDAFDYCRQKGWFVRSPLSAELKVATYNGEAYKIVNTPVDPIYYAGLVRDRLCTSPGGTGRYSGSCLAFCYYYQYCMVDNITDLSVSVALRRCQESRKLSYSVEKYSNANTMLARLYDLLSRGVPQILMVRAGTVQYSRHFVTVVGYRASVERREDLRAEDLLIIDSYDGNLEAMDSEVEGGRVRVLYTQEGKYRIETAWRR